MFRVSVSVHPLHGNARTGLLRTFFSQKKRGVHEISARNSGAGNGCANFMGAWHFLVLSAGKLPCP